MNSFIVQYKNMLLMLYILTLLIALLTYFIFDPNLINDIYNPIGFNEALFIFFYNSSIIIILLSFSWIGLPILYFVYVSYEVGMAGMQNNVHSLIYYTSVFPHLLLELLVINIVLIFSIKQFKVLYEYLRGSINDYEVKKFYKKLAFRTIPFIIAILFIGSLVEVYISNSLLLLLIDIFEDDFVYS